MGKRLSLGRIEILGLSGSLQGLPMRTGMRTSNPNPCWKMDGKCCSMIICLGTSQKQNRSVQTMRMRRMVSVQIITLGWRKKQKLQSPYVKVQCKLQPQKSCPSLAQSARVRQKADSQQMVRTVNVFGAREGVALSIIEKRDWNNFK